MWPWFHNMLVVVVLSLVVTWGFWKWFGKKWIEQRFAIALEKFQADQQKDLDGFKSEQQKKLERLRHLLSSRVSKRASQEIRRGPRGAFFL